MGRLDELQRDLQTWLREGKETFPPKELLEKVLVQVREDAKELDLDDLDILELTNLVLAQRKNALRKSQIWVSVRTVFHGNSLWKWRFGEAREVFDPQLRRVFEIVFSYLPLPSKLPRKRREYPLEKIRELKEEGLSVRKIAKELDIPKSTIHRLLKKL